ncbi:acyl-CoA dehydrogenase family protein [Calycomorphotria hydatis]|uniref:Acyl-CoA dehydrogenase n=1 Tax=Calycomorphotria hydatis TaxID=2528027 RepID=A0A517T9F4_9PLAN|nr:acyl-CoA dehydrogenase family protein [Calycomorphotria hydatis]QDT64996.1 Acyl-CoA dehydrogenase [Calycomorphotria hydatis]
MSHDIQDKTDQMHQTNDVSDKPTANRSFAETAMRMSGKSEDEARRMGAVDSADDRVEELFDKRYQTVNSPIHRAVWNRDFPNELFDPHPSEAAAEVRSKMSKALGLMKKRREEGHLYGKDGKLLPVIYEELASTGYWGLLVDKKYGGLELPFSQFAIFLRQMAEVEPTVAGLASVHGCIGAVDPLQTFGNEEQKSRFLPQLASGERLSAFALTEPGAGSDLTALKTTAVRYGDVYRVTGEKLFITNAIPGRTIGLVCLIDNEPSVLIVELPEYESESFHLNRYGIYALSRAHNNGLVFKDFEVPVENRLMPSRGDGLTIAYHGLNRGRVALCANAAGVMRMMLASMLPWARYRKTYGEPIAKRELVQRRVGQLAGYIVASDALVEWCAWLLDQGFRGEMECIVAKIFGSEMQKDAAIELFMKTHGGRAFLHGHMFGDNVHDFLAPCIYEGEGEMLGMAFFKSLVKDHGQKYFEPIGAAIQSAGIKKPNMMNPAHAWALRKPLTGYASWYLQEMIAGNREPELPAMSGRLERFALQAGRDLRNASWEITKVMRTYQLGLADRQCRMAELSGRIQNSVVMLVTALYAARHREEIMELAAECLCERISASQNGTHTTDQYYRRVTRLGKMLTEVEQHPLISNVSDDILMPY